MFVAIAINGIPIDALADRLGSNRNALYKTMFDARRKLRAVLAAHGYLTTRDVRPEDERTSEATMTGWAELERFLTDRSPRRRLRQALHIIHVYVEACLDDTAGAEAARRYPGVAAHLLACDPCAEDSTASCSP